MIEDSVTSMEETGGEGSPSPGGRDVGEGRQLDPRVVWLWRITGSIGWLFVLVPLLGVAVGVGGAVWHRLGLSLVLWCGVCLLVLLWQAWYPWRAYRAWSYQLDGRVLELRSGVWFQVVHLLPLSRLQHVDLQRGPLERSFGLASLVLYTAGTQEASLAIPGLADAEAERLRDTLVAIGGDDGV